MNWFNHFLLSFNLLFFILHNKASLKEMVVFAVIFGLLIDLEHVIKWFYGKDRAYLRTWVQEPFGFLIIGIPIATILSVFFEPYYFWLVTVPFASHILLDYLTVNEVSPFDPFSKKRFRLGFIRQYPHPTFDVYKKGVSENYMLSFNITLLTILSKLFI